MAKYAVRIVIDKLSEDENDYVTLLSLGDEDMVAMPGGVLASMLKALADEIAPPVPVVPKGYITTSPNIYGGTQITPVVSNGNS